MNMNKAAGFVLLLKFGNANFDCSMQLIQLVSEHIKHFKSYLLAKLSF